MANIVETATSAGGFTTLLAAVKTAGLVETLSGPGPFTVFAPNDEAFAKLPAGTVDALLVDIPQLTKILTYHVVSGKVMAADVVKLTAAKTVDGADLHSRQRWCSTTLTLLPRTLRPTTASSTSSTPYFLRTRRRCPHQVGACELALNWNVNWKIPKVARFRAARGLRPGSRCRPSRHWRAAHPSPGWAVTGLFVVTIGVAHGANDDAILARILPGLRGGRPAIAGLRGGAWPFNEVGYGQHSRLHVERVPTDTARVCTPPGASSFSNDRRANPHALQANPESNASNAGADDDGVWCSCGSIHAVSDDSVTVWVPHAWVVDSIC